MEEDDGAAYLGQGRRQGRGILRACRSPRRLSPLAPDDEEGTGWSLCSIARPRGGHSGGSEQRAHRGHVSASSTIRGSGWGEASWWSPTWRRLWLPIMTL